MNKPYRLLLVEDNSDDAELLLRVLDKNKIDYIHELVHTRKAFIKQLNKGDWDVIISDYSLPQFTGFEALVIVRKMDPFLPFILGLNPDRVDYWNVDTVNAQV